MAEWAAERIVDARLVRTLLAASGRPELAGADVPVTFLAEGWDNSVWLVDGRLVARVPRRRVALDGIRRELAVLPLLAPRLPLPIPVPEVVGGSAIDGSGDGDGAWPWFAAPLLPGRELAEAAHGAPGGGPALGRSLGAFLRALHAPATRDAAGASLPADPMGRGAMGERVPRARASLEEVRTAGLWSPSSGAKARAASVFDAAEVLPDAPPRALCHGDLHLRHVLVDDTAEAAAVIDWGDVCLGDPGIDLSLYWSHLDDDGRAAFRTAYGPVSEPSLLRGRVLALFLNAILASYAADAGNDGLRRAALAGLDRTLRPAP